MKQEKLVHNMCIFVCMCVYLCVFQISPLCVCLFLDFALQCNIYIIHLFLKHGIKRDGASWSSTIVDKDFLKACIQELTSNGWEGSG